MSLPSCGSGVTTSDALAITMSLRELSAGAAGSPDAAVVALQLVYDKLSHAVEYYWCPVKLTTDVSNPALYTIDAIGRGEGEAWQYNAQNNNITIVNKDASNLYHLWYFMGND